MTVMSLSALQKTGQFVSADMFGANAIFSETIDGVPSEAYESASDAFATQNIRFGGGQADLDPTNANDAGQFPVDGENAINIVTMPNGALRPELVNFLEWCRAKTAEGEPVSATLVLPTKHLSTAEYAAFAQDIEVFVETVMAQYGDVISAFQMGNEYWEMGETAYGIKASLGVEAIATALNAAGIAEDAQPDILVQMATAGNEGSEFPAVPGVNDFVARNTAANNTIIDQLSDEARSAIDGVTEHYYYNKTDYEFLPAEYAVKNINRDYDIWVDAFDRDLDLVITEWNIKTTTTEQQGIVAASTLVKQFENMIEIGVDAAHIWALDYHSRTALTLRSDEGAFLDDTGRVLNSAQGAVFDLMSDALVGKELISASFDHGVPGIEVTSYASADEIVFYISSRSFEQTSFTLDLASQLPNLGPVSAVQIAIDPATSNGQQWLNGEDADFILLEGEPYFYNEHDVDVTLTDITFPNPGDITLDLNPFEVVQLTASLNGPSTQEPNPNATSIVAPPSVPVTPDEESFLGTDDADLIALTSVVQTIDGGEGLDHLLIDAARQDADIRFEDDGTVSLTINADTVALTQIERLEFSDGTLALDTEGHSGQAYRLYEASFDRTPDVAGLAFWVGQLDLGVTLDQAATLFLNSAEFEQTFGDNNTLSDTDFIDLMYANVLDRAPDQLGYDYWRAQQENNLSREDILVAFSESAENKANVAQFIDDGIWLA